MLHNLVLIHYCSLPALFLLQAVFSVWWCDPALSFIDVQKPTQCTEAFTHANDFYLQGGYVCLLVSKITQKLLDGLS